ncbi:C-terminal binding protein [Metabacillus sediminilitoris]|uniref:C-terminal binding protein n=1 Tax=Metabacillus sediminilitoris TaxID=2567941 RepID=A0A4S4C128_9BACI|nr:C-terminal binding protein [Metabacillus sediminilitoris]QGQ46155.1 C-terminal binding protein [Metabacillus sediminilitoris]THF79208.1 C-terminal binding protein [Metabacillus sediminilitoris]
MAYKVILTDYEFENLQYEEEVFQNSGLDIEFIKVQCKTEEEVIEHAKDADAILNQYAPVSRRVIESLQNTKIISRYGVGVNTIDLDAAKEKRITVANVPDYGMEEVSNHALALLLSWARKVTLLNNEVKKGNWDFKACVPIHRFNEQTVGVLGFGRIPRRLIEKVKPLGFKTVAYDPFVSGEEMAAVGVEKMELDDLIRHADYLSVHVPLIPDTYHLINEERLSKMKRNAVIINTARGPIIDEKALADALKKGIIAGAALDVTEEEPVSINNPLLEMDNVIITPHSAWYSEEAMIELRQKAAKNIVQVLSGTKTPYALT